MIRVIRVGLVVLSLLFMANVVVGEWNKITNAAWDFRYDLLGFSLIGAVIIFFLDAFGWHLILSALGRRLSPIKSIQVWLLSSLARYIPGAIWSYTSRVALAKAEGVDGVTVGLSLYIETLLLMVSSLAIGALVLLWDVELPFNRTTAIIICLLLGVTLHPRVLRLLGKLPGRLGDTLRGVHLPSTHTIFLLYLYYLVFWVLFGATFVLFVLAIHPLPVTEWLPVGATLALGFFVGFVVVFAPGGIGVRESALYLLLLPFVPASASIVISVGSRLWIMAAEGVSLAFVLLAGKRRRRSPPG